MNNFFKKLGIFIGYLLLLAIGIIMFIAFGIGGIIVYLLIIGGVYFIFLKE